VAPDSAAAKAQPPSAIDRKDPAFVVRADGGSDAGGHDLPLEQAKEGREVDAMKFADEVDAMYARLEDEGWVAAHEWWPNFTGTDDDMFIVRG